MALNDVWECNCIQVLGTVVYSNVFFLKQTTVDGQTIDPEQSAANALVNDFFQDLSEELHIFWRLQCIEVDRSFVTGLPPGRYIQTLMGQRNGNHLTPQQVALFNYQTEDGGRGRQGRTAISGLLDEDEIDNNLTPTRHAALQLVANKLVQTLTDPTDGVEFECGPKPDQAANFKKWILSDTRVPFSTIRNRRPSVGC